MNSFGRSLEPLQRLFGRVTLWQKRTLNLKYSSLTSNFLRKSLSKLNAARWNFVELSTSFPMVKKGFFELSFFRVGNAKNKRNAVTFFVTLWHFFFENWRILFIRCKFVWKRCLNVQRDISTTLTTKDRVGMCEDLLDLCDTPSACPRKAIRITLKRYIFAHLVLAITLKGTFVESSAAS